jgi:hypothetical protein
MIENRRLVAAWGVVVLGVGALALVIGGAYREHGRAGAVTTAPPSAVVTPSPLVARPDPPAATASPRPPTEASARTAPVAQRAVTHPREGAAPRRAAHAKKVRKTGATARLRTPRPARPSTR